ncbi:hypothetical protein CWB99_14480 [Pseudoalteromonas rubra]|uniref:Nuclear transport factor 2 family protein n=1 Tax=Pseudoalteromonas rubra TaxID=43658 RepID=A0A5S3WLR3_9GAMM|nr:nuclear transport factor 2 family protein [Pseudoalteromonas rubra]TMP27489.1 hypothetical protein CWB99_14480 [Pseudoalteromonas rubra]TMP28991.1 hypothetical protein CWC00_20070 [Pseudoalteromonas rubra]
MAIYIQLILTCCVLVSGYSYATTEADKQAIEFAAKGYLIAQIEVRPELMAKVTDDELIKRTYWRDQQGEEFVMAMGKQGMIELAAEYNRVGTRFAAQPKMELRILDIDKRVATVKLITDEWIDYMHLYKTASGEWQILNVLWQLHQIHKHKSVR